MAQPKYKHFNKRYVYLTQLRKQEISHLIHILNEKCEPLLHNELKQKYHINTAYLQTTQIHNCIPKQWLCKLKSCSNIAPIHKVDIKMKVNKKNQ